MLRFATLGTSWITTEFADAVARVPGVEVVCAYSRDAARAATFADRIGAPAAAADLPRLLASPEVDAVYVATPNSVHLEQSLAAVRAGKHVLVEKPATPDAAGFARLVAEADAAGVVLLEAMRSAYDPGMARARELVGRLGTLRRASLRFCQRSSRYDQVLAGERVNIFDPALAGGALNDLGVYCVRTMVELFGEPSGLVAASVPLPGGADGAGTVVARYPGLVVDLGYSKITASDVHSEVQGEAATLVLDSIAAPRRLVVRAVDGTEEVVAVDAPAFTLEYEVAHFARLCRDGGSAAPDQALTLATLRTLEAIRSAAVPVG